MTLPWPDDVLLAPLTKGGNLPFRRLCVDFGAVVTCSEMAYAHHVVRGSSRELALLRHHESETFFGVQIAAHKADLARDAALVAVERGARYIDINAGCPIDDTVKRGMGARLLQRTRALEDIVKALVEAVDVPVTVKIRSGFKANRENADEVARMCEEAGAAAIILHGRTREQRYSRAADWDAVGALVQARGIPVVGNGDILTWYEARDRRARSGAAGIMLARGALIKPWLFQEIREGRELALDARERLGIYHRLAGYFREHFGDDELGHRRVMGFLPWHFSFFCRYRHLPESEWGEAAAEHPLLQSRDTKPDLDVEDPLEALLASQRHDVHGEIAELLWAAADLDEVIAGATALAIARRDADGLAGKGRVDNRGWG